MSDIAASQQSIHFLLKLMTALVLSSWGGAQAQSVYVSSEKDNKLMVFDAAGKLHVLTARLLLAGSVADIPTRLGARPATQIAPAGPGVPSTSS